jgi:hypothetical protein
MTGTIFNNPKLRILSFREAERLEASPQGSETQGAPGFRLEAVVRKVGGFVTKYDENRYTH